ncbi:MAG: 30S ribosomal protein S12 methylthiotransferase RimO [Deltaproteobacteria bacterium]|nr:30S ribosomal protein S12 methylthiotransferase RimO [Deltaproteobacteria bacterium]
MVDRKKKVFLISLGCAKNLVDSENMLGLLEEAEIAIVNTCGFIQPAVEESIDTILEVAAHKKKGKLGKLFVAGCFVQRYGYQLRKEIPEVDGWFGTGELLKIVDILGEEFRPSPSFFISRPTFLADHTVPRIRTTPFYSAYLKIAEGCSHRCSYCTIPRLRGPFRSRGLASLLIEAENMVENGVKEINLIAQDTTMYGKDLGESICLEDLLERLVQISGIEWIRILYGHPFRISDRLLELMDRGKTICPYLDLPLQHVNVKILDAMGRGYKGENPLQLIERIRSGRRHVSLRTTVMVGFPGETDEIFDELYHFVEIAQFDCLGAFIFSPERGTPAARLKGIVERDVARKRLEAIMELQAEISLKKNRRMIGRVEPVLIEGVSPETDLLLRGRTATMAPDVDSQVLINRGQGNVGEIVPVLIKEAHPYDLIGEII